MFVRIEVGGTVVEVPVTALERDTALGRPVISRVTVPRAAMDDRHLEGLAGRRGVALAKGEVARIGAYTDDGRLLMSGDWRTTEGDPWCVQLCLLNTPPPPSALRARRRVYTAVTAADLLGAFADVVEPSDDVGRLLGSPLREDALPVDQIQMDMSDLEAVRVLIARLMLDLGLPPMVLSGFEGQDRLRVHLARGSDYRLLPAAPSGPGGDVAWDAVVAPSPCDWLPPASMAIRQVRGPFDPTLWATPCELPFARDGGWSWRRVDRVLCDPAGNWTKEEHDYVLPLDGVVPSGGSLTSRGAPRLWGRVVSTDLHAPTIAVSFPGFEAGAETAVAHLLTPTSGRGGATGLHFAPEAQSYVVVSCSESVIEPPLCNGNPRLVTTTYPAPSLGVERPVTADLDDVAVVGLGKIQIDAVVDATMSNDLRIAVSGPAELRVAGTLEAQVEQAAHAHLAGGLRLESIGGVAFQVDGTFEAQASEDLVIGSDRGASVVGAACTLVVDERVSVQT